LCRPGFEVLEVVEQTSRVFPLNHLLVYGIGKPLLQKGLLPTRLRMSADRFQSEKHSGSWLNPINLAVSALRRVDRRNDRPTGASVVS
jgi:hypothetical protein